MRNVEMTGETGVEIPETGAIFTFGKSKLAKDVPSKFWMKNDHPVHISCGGDHTAVITGHGRLFMFGSNASGQLGLGTKPIVHKPTSVKELKSEKMRSAACGRDHTIVCTWSGNVYGSGSNQDGQLGLGHNNGTTSFQRLNNVCDHMPIKMLAAGCNNSAALTEDGRLYMWGDNSVGQIGLGEERHTLEPREIDVGQPVAWVSCGSHHSAFVTVKGDLYTFGESSNGRLGLYPEDLSNHRVPQRVQTIQGHVMQVSCGGEHTVALTEGDVYTFGRGQYGQLGQGTFLFETAQPRALEAFRNGRFNLATCGDNHTAVITDRGVLYMFGDGRHGKLGLGEENFTNQFRPTICPRFQKYYVQSVSCGGNHMLVLATPRHLENNNLEEFAIKEDTIMETIFEQRNALLFCKDDPITPTPPTAPPQCTARSRRRERERYLEQFGLMFCNLPSLTSGFLDTSSISINGAPPKKRSKDLPMPSLSPKLPLNKTPSAAPCPRPPPKSPLSPKTTYKVPQSPLFSPNSSPTLRHFSSQTLKATSKKHSNINKSSASQSKRSPSSTHASTEDATAEEMDNLSQQTDESVTALQYMPRKAIIEEMEERTRNNEDTSERYIGMVQKQEKVKRRALEDVENYATGSKALSIALLENSSYSSCLPRIEPPKSPKRLKSPQTPSSGKEIITQQTKLISNKVEMTNICKPGTTKHSKSKLPGATPSILNHRDYKELTEVKENKEAKEISELVSKAGMRDNPGTQKVQKAIKSLSKKENSQASLVEEKSQPSVKPSVKIKSKDVEYSKVRVPLFSDYARAAEDNCTKVQSETTSPMRIKKSIKEVKSPTKTRSERQGLKLKIKKKESSKRMKPEAPEGHNSEVSCSDPENIPTEKQGILVSGAKPCLPQRSEFLSPTGFKPTSDTKVESLSTQALSQTGQDSQGKAQASAPGWGNSLSDAASNPPAMGMVGAAIGALSETVMSVRDFPSGSDTAASTCSRRSSRTERFTKQMAITESSLSSAKSSSTSDPSAVPHVQEPGIQQQEGVRNKVTLDQSGRRTSDQQKEKRSKPISSVAISEDSQADETDNIQVSTDQRSNTDDKEDGSDIEQFQPEERGEQDDGTKCRKGLSDHNKGDGGNNGSEREEESNGKEEQGKPCDSGRSQDKADGYVKSVLEGSQEEVEAKSEGEEEENSEGDEDSETGASGEGKEKDEGSDSETEDQDHDSEMSEAGEDEEDGKAKAESSDEGNKSEESSGISEAKEKESGDDSEMSETGEAEGEEESSEKETTNEEGNGVSEDEEIESGDDCEMSKAGEEEGEEESSEEENKNVEGNGESEDEENESGDESEISEAGEEEEEGEEESSEEENKSVEGNGVNDGEEKESSEEIESEADSKSKASEDEDEGKEESEAVESGEEGEEDEEQSEESGTREGGKKENKVGAKEEEDSESEEEERKASESEVAGDDNDGKSGEDEEGEAEENVNEEKVEENNEIEQEDGQGVGAAENDGAEESDEEKERGKRSKDDVEGDSEEDRNIEENKEVSEEEAEEEEAEEDEGESKEYSKTEENKEDSEEEEEEEADEDADDDEGGDEEYSKAKDNKEDSEEEEDEEESEEDEGGDEKDGAEDEEEDYEEEEQYNKNKGQDVKLETLGEEEEEEEEEEEDGKRKGEIKYMESGGRMNSGESDKRKEKGVGERSNEQQKRGKQKVGEEVPKEELKSEEDQKEENYELTNNTDESEEEEEGEEESQVKRSLAMVEKKSRKETEEKNIEEEGEDDEEEENKAVASKLKEQREVAEEEKKEEKGEIEEGEEEEEENEEDEEEEEEEDDKKIKSAKNINRGKQKVPSKMTPPGREGEQQREKPKPAVRTKQKTTGETPTNGSQGSQQFWNNVLPRYLDLQ